MADQSNRAGLRLPAFFKPPVFADQEATRQARTLFQVAWGVIVVQTVFLGSLAFIQSGALMRAVDTMAWIDLVALAALVVNRFGKTRPASILLIVGLMASVWWRALDQGGIRSPGMSKNLAFILMASVLLGERGAVVTAAGVTLSAAALAGIEALGFLTAKSFPYSLTSLLMLNLLYVGIVLILSRLVSRDIRQALARANDELARRRVTEGRLEFALAAGEIAVWEIDPRSRRLIGNDRAFALLGVPVPANREFSIDEWTASIHPEDVPQFQRDLQLSIDGARVHTSYRVVHPDGTVRFVEASRMSLSEEAGRPARVIGMVMDVTERRKAEEAREKLLYSYKERIKESLAIQAASALVLEQAAVADTLMQRFTDLLPPAFQFPEITKARVSYAGHSAQTPGFRETAWLLRQDFSTSDGAKGALEVCYLEEKPGESEGPFYVEERRLLETLARILSTFFERRLAERALKENEAKYRNVVETSEEAILTTDKDLHITLVNPKLCSLLGYAADELLGQPGTCILFPEDIPVIMARRELRRKSGISTQFDMNLRRKDGTSVPVVASAKDMRDASGALEGSVVMMTDMTARNQLQADLLQSQKIEAMGKLSGGVAHDFNNLLTAILGFSELIKMTMEAGDPRLDDVKQIIDTAHRAAALTRQLLAFSRKQVLQAVPLELNAIIGDMEKMLKRIIGEDISLAARLDPELGCCKADRGQLEQVVLNLVVNARDAMPKGGAITVSTGNAELAPEEAEPLGAAPGPYLRLAVTDTGEGMSEETQRRIFEPFFTTKPVGKGTGLGLSTVHGIVKQSGAYLKVRSKLGEGTTFEILLPAVARPEAEGAAAAKPAARAGRETVLLVDDDETVRKVSLRLLTAAGYRIIETNNGRDGLDALEKEKGRIDLLITDVVMPGMSGFDFAKKARSLRPDLRVLFISGYLDRDQPADATGPGFSYLQKPFSASDFNARVREVLDAPPPA